MPTPKELWEYPIENPYNGNKPQSAESLLAYIGSRQGISEATAKAQQADFDALAAKVDALAAKVETLANAPKP